MHFIFVERTFDSVAEQRYSYYLWNLYHIFHNRVVDQNIKLVVYLSVKIKLNSNTKYCMWLPGRKFNIAHPSRTISHGYHIVDNYAVI